MLKIPFIVKNQHTRSFIPFKEKHLQCRNEKSSMLKFIIIYFLRLESQIFFFDGYGQVVSFKQNFKDSCDVSGKLLTTLLFKWHPWLLRKISESLYLILDSCAFFQAAR